MWIPAHFVFYSCLMLIWVPLHLHPHNVPVILLTTLFTYFVLIFEHNRTPISGKKTVTGVQVLAASQVQSIGCRWQAVLSSP